MLRAETFHSIFDAFPDAVVITDVGGRIVMTNSQATHIFGYSADELVGNEVEILIPNRLMELHRGHRKGYANSPHKRAMGAGLDLVALKKDQTEIDVEISLSFVTLDGEPYILAAIRDISEKKATSNRLKQALIELESKNKELEQFAFIASHDLQEPLRTVSSFVGLLKEEYYDKLSQEANQYIDFTLDSTERMRNLINGLLDYSRLGKDHVRVRTDMNGILSTVLRDTASSLTSCDAVITSDRLPTVLANPLTIKELLQNLIVNAVKFRTPGTSPNIHLSSVKRKQEWIISVRDDGIGIDPKFKDKIFNIFQRLNNRSDYAGYGIGLAHCKKIAELHGGRIWVEANHGRGSTFFFTLPIQNKYEKEIELRPAS
jgi:PAS domain S-box-containing protein